MNETINLRHLANQAKLTECFAQISSMDIVPKSKMFKFYTNVSKAFGELDREFVNCRRTRRINWQYEELEQKYYKCITVFEQWSLMAALTY